MLPVSEINSLVGVGFRVDVDSDELALAGMMEGVGGLVAMVGNSVAYPDDVVGVTGSNELDDSDVTEDSEVGGPGVGFLVVVEAFSTAGGGVMPRLVDGTEGVILSVLLDSVSLIVDA